MRIKTICFIRNGNKFEEKGLMIETPTSTYFIDAVGQMLYECELSDYRADWNFITNIDMGTF